MNFRQTLERYMQEYVLDKPLDNKLKLEIRMYIEGLIQKLIYDGMINPLFKDDLYDFIVSTVRISDGFGEEETITDE